MALYLLAKLISFFLLCIAVFIVAQVFRDIDTESFTSGLSGALVCGVFQFAAGWVLFLWMMPTWYWLGVCASGVAILYLSQFFVDGFSVRLSGAVQGGVALGVFDGMLQQVCDTLL